MINMRACSKEINVYELGAGFRIERVEDSRQFSIHYAIYNAGNPFYDINWKDICEEFSDSNSSFWIYKDKERIGGLRMSPNEILCLFVIPPYSEVGYILERLVKLLLFWSDRTKKIYGYTVLEGQIKEYSRLGFKINQERRCMIRPTETFQVEWDKTFILETPSREKEKEIA